MRQDGLDHDDGVRQADDQGGDAQAAQHIERSPGFPQNHRKHEEKRNRLDEIGPIEAERGAPIGGDQDRNGARDE